MPNLYYFAIHAWKFSATTFYAILHGLIMERLGYRLTSKCSLFLAHTYNGHVHALYRTHVRNIACLTLRTSYLVQDGTHVATFLSSVG